MKWMLFIGLILAWAGKPEAAVNCNGNGVSIIGSYYVGEGAIGDTGTSNGFHYAEIIFKNGSCSDRMYFSSQVLWDAVILSKSRGITIAVQYCEGCTGGVIKTFGNITVTARLDLASPGTFNCFVKINSGDVNNFNRFVKSLDHCTIALEGAFNLSSAILVSNKRDLTISGQNAIWQTSSQFRLTVSDSREFVIKNIQINDISAPTNLFEFNNCSYSGLENIRYTGTSPLRHFAVFKNGTDHGFVTNSSIKNVNTGIMFGVEAPEKIEPYSQPVIKPSASFCLAENNLIENFETQAIATRASTNMGGIEPYLLYMRLGTIIRGNNVINPNVSRGSCPSNNHGCFIGIEAWGGDVIIENNTIVATPGSNVNTGISLAYGYGITCRNNYVLGGYNYQGIELQEVDYSTITGNVIENVKNPYDTMTAGIGISVDAVVLGFPKSAKNKLSKNKIKNCDRGILLDENSTLGTLIVEDTIIDCGTALWTWGEQFEIRGSVFKSNDRAFYLGAGLAISEPSRIIGNYFINTNTSIIWNDADQTGTRGRPFIFDNNYVEGWGNSIYPEAIMLRCGPSFITNNIFKKDSISRNFSPIITAKRQDSYKGRFLYNVTGNGKGPGVGTTVPWWMGDLVPLGATGFPVNGIDYPQVVENGNYNL